MESKLGGLFSQIGANQELEVKFNYREKSLTIDVFQDVLKHLKAVSVDNTSELQVKTELDINYNHKEGSYDIFRLTVDGLEAINETIKVYATKPNNITFSLLAGKILKSQSGTLSLMSKDKDKYKDLSFDDDDYNIRCRLSEELQQKPNKKLLNLPEMDKLNISYRFKNRVRLVVEKNDSYQISVDLTSVKSSKSLLKLGTVISTYELELELMKFNDTKLDSKAKKTFQDYLDKILMWINKTDYILTEDVKREVLSAYKDLVGNQDIIRLYSMQPETLSLPKLTDFLANNYGVTDKADGEKCALFTYKKKVYYISNTLGVSYSGIEVKDLGDNTLAEGEYIQESKSMMLFDIMYFEGNDVRGLNLRGRLNKLGILVRLLNKDSFQFEEYNKKDIEIKEVEAFYKKQLEAFIKYLNTSKPKVERKFFLICQGIHSSEIFRFSTLLMTMIKNVYYKQDGLIYTGIEQKYTTNAKEIEFVPLKWKPQELNTIDMYIEFVKNESGQIQNVFDNSDPNIGEGVIFRIANLYVGRVKDKKETPTPFMPRERLDVAYFAVSNDNVRDLEENIVNDKTVLELAYEANDMVPPQYRWKILRTRYDKTYNVQQHQKQYGNNEVVARKIFETIMNPIRYVDLEKLGEDYDNYIEIMKQRVSTKLIEVSKQEDAYYQFKSNLAQPMKKYHNYVKDILFQYYMPKELKSGHQKKLTVLDFGIGRGGDILKFYHAGVKEVVGLDPDLNGLFNASDSAFSRYENQRKKKPYFTQMTFIQASMGELLEVDKQLTLFPNMTQQNKEMIKKHLSRQYDCINCQFAIHYVFTTDGFSNLVMNINKLLSEDGYFVATTFDAHLVKEYLGGQKEKSEYFVSDDGVKEVLFTLRDVSIGEKPGLDQALDFYTPMYMNEGTFQTEYLVYPEFVISEFKKKCNMRLVESQRFRDLIQKQEQFFTETIKTESDQRRKQFFVNDVQRFYEDKSSLNVASKSLSMLYRYYVFQKQS